MGDDGAPGFVCASILIAPTAAASAMTAAQATASLILCILKSAFLWREAWWRNLPGPLTRDYIIGERTLSNQPALLLPPEVGLRRPPRSSSGDGYWGQTQSSTRALHVWQVGTHSAGRYPAACSGDRKTKSACPACPSA